MKIFFAWVVIVLIFCFLGFLAYCLGIRFYKLLLECTFMSDMSEKKEENKNVM